MQDWNLPSGREVYDTLMRRINPSLVTDKLPHLDDGFGDESPEQRKIRYAKYQEDFARYSEAYEQWIAQTKAAADTYCRQALKSAESGSRTQETSTLQHLETQLNSAA
jgi:hypothetical protein